MLFHHAVAFYLLIILLSLSAIIALSHASGESAKAESARAVVAPDTSSPAQEMNAKNELIVGIVRDHDDVLHFWGKLVLQGKVARDGLSGLPLLHVDAHSDASIPTGGYAFHSIAHQNNFNMDKIRNITEIGDFIIVAQWMGLVSDIVWLQPDWPSSQFNFQGEPVRTHQWQLVRRKRAAVKKGESFLCLASTKSSPQEHITSLPAIVPIKAQCANDEEQDHRHIRVINWSVMSLGEAQANVSSFVQADKPFLLDIDLDTFACVDPEAEYNWPAAKFGHYFDYLESLVGKETLCLSEDVDKRKEQQEDLTLLLGDVFWNGLTFLEGVAKPIHLVRPRSGEEEFEFVEGLFNLWCKGPDAGRKALVEASKLSRLLIEKMEPSQAASLRSDYHFPNISCHDQVNGLFGLCYGGDVSRPFPSEVEVDAQIASLESVLRRLGQLAPVLVTVARSPEYTPQTMQPYIEKKVLAMLKRVYSGRTLVESYIDQEKPLPELVESWPDNSSSHLLSKRDTKLVEKLERDLIVAFNTTKAWVRMEQDAFDVISEANLIIIFGSDRGMTMLELLSDTSVFDDWFDENERELDRELSSMAAANKKSLLRVLSPAGSTR